MSSQDETKQAAATEPTNPQDEPTVTAQTYEYAVPTSKAEKELEQKMVKVISGMPAKIQPRFQVLHILSDMRSKINDEFEKEVKALSLRFDKKKAPILEKRNKILSGELEEFDQFKADYDSAQAKLTTIVAGIVKSDEEKKEDEEEDAKHKPTDVAYLKDKKGVPDFWKKAIQNNAMLSQIVTEKDREVLEHLVDVKCVQSEEPSINLKVSMKFAPNDFFTNEVLEYTAFQNEGEGTTNEIVGCEIMWNEGKDVTKKKIKKTQKHKKTNEKRVIVKTVPCDSVFNIFESKKAPEGIEDKDEDELDSDDEKTMQALDEANDFTNDLYDMYNGEALEYYLNFGPSVDDLMNAYGDEMDSDGDSDEDDKPKKSTDKKEGDAPAKQVGPDGKEQECKQQ